MSWDIGIADRLRAQGLNVVEVAGWRTRGSTTFNPRGSVNHHTAGPRGGNSPSLNICINGRRDLPGPLCNVYQARDNTIYVVAAGRANHAGSGGWAGLSGNSSVYGLEVENIGTVAEPWRPDQIDTMAKVHAALIRGRADASKVCHHKEWTTRKPDAHTIPGNTFRAKVAGYLNPAPPPPASIDWAAVRRLTAFKTLETLRIVPAPPPSPSLAILVIQSALNQVASSGIRETGVWDDATIKAVVKYQDDVNRFFGRQLITDFPGAFGDTTKFWLCLALDNIVKGA